MTENSGIDELQAAYNAAVALIEACPCDPDSTRPFEAAWKVFREARARYDAVDRSNMLVCVIDLAGKENVTRNLADAAVDLLVMHARDALFRRYRIPEYEQYRILTPEEYAAGKRDDL